MSGGGVTRISISIPPDLLKELDDVLKKVGYDRSKAIQIAIRNFLTEYRWTHESGEVAGALILLYDHRSRGVEGSLTDIQHEYGNIITSTMHVHLDEDNCLEIVALKGSSKSIKELVERVIKEKGVKQLKLALVAT
ncbi:MAG: nickel-responsive transcriptional regulator NikR [Nitrososphaerota archaeon]|nr:nickel-responsive transcriptional regulator NikR [Aigarchaeota archaeon]MDW8077209.1 nickel-responsive transcriptional regulator NikR [Nitrososphaerota archaeon]